MHTQSAYGGESACGLDIMLDFLDDPQTEPDTSCIDSILDIDFSDSSGFGAALLGTDDMWENTAKGGHSKPRQPPPGYDRTLRQLGLRWHQLSMAGR